jgi:hypothetical protein
MYGSYYLPATVEAAGIEYISHAVHCGFLSVICKQLKPTPFRLLLFVSCISRQKQDRR